MVEKEVSEGPFENILLGKGEKEIIEHIGNSLFNPDEYVEFHYRGKRERVYGVDLIKALNNSKTPQERERALNAIRLYIAIKFQEKYRQDTLPKTGVAKGIGEEEFWEVIEEKYGEQDLSDKDKRDIWAQTQLEILNWRKGIGSPFAQPTAIGSYRKEEYYFPPFIRKKQEQ